MISTNKHAWKLVDKLHNNLVKVQKLTIQPYRRIENNPCLATIEQVKSIAEQTGVSFEQLFLSTN